MGAIEESEIEVFFASSACSKNYPLDLRRSGTMLGIYVILIQTITLSHKVEPLLYYFIGHPDRFICKSIV